MVVWLGEKKTAKRQEEENDDKNEVEVRDR